MIFDRFTPKRLLLVGALVFAPICAHAEVLFKDGFEGDNLLQKTLSTLTSTTALWSDNAYVSVVSGTARTGTYSASFPFTPANPWCELRFDLGKLVTELWVQYDLYIPTNYYHQALSGSNNNKFFRLWGNTYDDHEKVGFSTWANSPVDGYSQMIGDWDSTGGGMGPSGATYANVISAADKGKWVTFKMYFKAPTATAKGTMKMWKNGTLIVDDSNQVNNYTSTELHAYRYGYILGWSNSGYTSNTTFYVDNAVFGTTEADLGGATASPPSAPVLQGVKLN